jgi:hypothetical protein
MCMTAAKGGGDIEGRIVVNLTDWDIATNTLWYLCTSHRWQDNRLGPTFPTNSIEVTDLVVVICGYVYDRPPERV